MTKFLHKAVFPILLLAAAFSANAQNVAKDKTTAPQDKVVIDKVVAVVGSEAILLSDLEMEISQQRMQGTLLSGENLSCKILEYMLANKLLVAQAKIDSLSADPNSVNSTVNERINQFISRLGSEKAVEAQFKKPVAKIKELLRDQAEEQLLAQQMQSKIVGKIEITPSDVEEYFKSIPKDSLKKVPEQYEFQQITLYPPASDANFKVKERLLQLRERIMKGERFNTLATLYSEDEASASRGGELGLAAATDYVSAFRNAALALKPGQVSQIVETEYGFHIIQMIEKQGDLINVRHILLKPSYSNTDMRKAFARLDSIKNFITADSISFDNAARLFSADEKTRTNGGLVASPYTLSPRFDKDQLRPKDYYVLKELKPGQISEPFQSLDDNNRTVYKIIKLKEIFPSHTMNLKDDFALLQNNATGKKQEEKYRQWLGKKQLTTYIRIDPDYRNCNFESKNWVK